MGTTRTDAGRLRPVVEDDPPPRRSSSRPVGSFRPGSVRSPRHLGPAARNASRLGWCGKLPILRHADGADGNRFRTLLPRMRSARRRACNRSSPIARDRASIALAIGHTEGGHPYGPRRLRPEGPGDVRSVGYVPPDSLSEMPHRASARRSGSVQVSWVRGSRSVRRPRHSLDPGRAGDGAAGGLIQNGLAARTFRTSEPSAIAPASRSISGDGDRSADHGATRSRIARNAASLPVPPALGRRSSRA
jgi:hypothetical protein